MLILPRKGLITSIICVLSISKFLLLHIELSNNIPYTFAFTSTSQSSSHYHYFQTQYPNIQQNVYFQDAHCRNPTFINKHLNQNDDIASDPLLDEITVVKISKRQRIKNLFRRIWIWVKSEDARVTDMKQGVDEDIDPMGKEVEEDELHIPNINMEIDTDSNLPENNCTESEIEIRSQPLPLSLPLSSTTDLSGTWKPIVTSKFKDQYDEYLLNCSQSFVFRKIVVNGIGLQKEIIHQHENDLQIIATNPAGDWERTLIHNEEITIVDPDGDCVKVESAWEEEGMVHRSWLRGKPRVHGGVFDTRRYLESDNVLVCESNFIPSKGGDDRFKFGHVIWRFERC